jgi:hypothetical protein
MGPSTIKPAIYSHTSTFLCCFACFLFPDCRNLLLFEVKKKKLSYFRDFNVYCRSGNGFLFAFTGNLGKWKVI